MMAALLLQATLKTSSAVAALDCSPSWTAVPSLKRKRVRSATLMQIEFPRDFIGEAALSASAFICAILDLPKAQEVGPSIPSGSNIPDTVHTPNLPDS